MPTSFTVMTWNVENLFPPGHRVGPRKVVSQGDYDAKLDYLAAKILQINPHVLALQEMGGSSLNDTRSFDDLRGRLQGRYPHAAPSQYPDGRLIRVGFLSQLPLIGVPQDLHHPLAPVQLALIPNWNAAVPVVEMGRGALRIEVEPLPGLHIRLVTLHLKSKLISYPASNGDSQFAPDTEDERTAGEGLALFRRTAEAATVRAHLNGLMRSGDSAQAIVLGDFNDEPRAATSQLLLGPPDADASKDDQLDFARLYSLVDSIPLRGDETKDKRFLTDTERFTRIYQGRRELIDHILVSKGLLGASADLRADRWKVQEVRSLVADIAGQEIGDNPAERVGERCPDHAPVYARFLL